jgi:hypothetical protein
MALDKMRWDERSSQGMVVRTALGDWSTEDSLLFFDSRVYEMLPDGLREKCRPVEILPLKGIGKRQCWAARISELRC